MDGLVPAALSVSKPLDQAGHSGRSRAELRTEDFLPFLRPAQRVPARAGWERASEAAALMAYAAPFALAFPIIAASPLWVLWLMSGPNGAWPALLQTGWRPPAS